jgi:hypothetical protein
LVAFVALAVVFVLDLASLFVDKAAACCSIGEEVKFGGVGIVRSADGRGTFGREGRTVGGVNNGVVAGLKIDNAVTSFRIFECSSAMLCSWLSSDETCWEIDFDSSPSSGAFASTTSLLFSLPPFFFSFTSSASFFSFAAALRTLFAGFSSRETPFFTVASSDVATTFLGRPRFFGASVMITRGIGKRMLF